MNKILLYKYVIFILLFSNNVFAQDLDKSLVKWLEKYSKEELDSRLTSIKLKYPNSAVPLFLEAYIEQDGERAVKLYNQIIQNYPNSTFADDALLKIAQYYYALGSYVSARQYLDNLIDQYSDSPLIPEAKYISARCLIATGYYYTAEEELKEITKKYSSSPFKSQARQELRILDDLSKEEQNPLQLSNPIINSETQGTISQDKKKFTIQIGAFRDQNNALREKEVYSQKGYLVAINSKDVNGDLLYMVSVGEFETEVQAATFGEVFKKLHGVSFHVVKK